MKIVQATYETKEIVRESYADLMKYKSHLAEFSDLEERSIIIRCSSEEKAEEVKGDIREATGEPKRLKILNPGDEGGGKLEKLRKFGEGVKKGVKTAQKAANTASKQVGGVAKSPKGGMTRQIFSSETSSQGEGASGKVRAEYESEDEVRSAMEKLSDKGIPEEAMQGFKEIDPTRWFLVVRCSSREKAERAKAYIKEVSDPEDVKT